MIAIPLAIAAFIPQGVLGSKYGLEISNFVLSPPKLIAPICVVQLTNLHNREFGKTMSGWRAWSPARTRTCSS